MKYTLFLVLTTITFIGCSVHNPIKPSENVNSVQVANEILESSFKDSLNITHEQSLQNFVSRKSNLKESSCEFSPSERLNKYKQLSCYVSKIAERCNKIDRCYVVCFNTDLHRSIGGGCNHICNRGGRLEWAPPDDITQCRSAPPLLR